LHYHPDLTAPDSVHVGGSRESEICAVELDSTAGLTHAGREKAQHGPCRHGFAAAGLADYRQEFAVPNRERERFQQWLAR
jgi:hypothetical protein